jgi:hypothetical protein
MFLKAFDILLNKERSQKLTILKYESVYKKRNKHEERIKKCEVCEEKTKKK